jgi:hypothetical protein
MVRSHTHYYQSCLPKAVRCGGCTPCDPQEVLQSMAVENHHDLRFLHAADVARLKYVKWHITLSPAVVAVR